VTFRGPGSPLTSCPPDSSRSSGTRSARLAVCVVAAATFRRRPLGNTLIVLGVAIAAIGSALAGLGASSTAAFAAAGVVVLYAGFTMRARTSS
jgi:Flp pilus assembly protein protease CpaA